MRGDVTKVAMIRGQSYPVGVVAPLHLNCPCGTQLTTELYGPNVTCTCGKTYTYNGWVVTSELRVSGVGEGLLGYRS